MARSRTSKRNRLIDRYNSRYKKVPYELFKCNVSLLHDLFDQYHQAMKYLQNEKADEDKALSEYYRCVAQPGSASGLGPEGRLFKSSHTDHFSSQSSETQDSKS